MDEFDLAFQPGLDARKIKDLAGLGFIDATSNIAQLGPLGVGKTMFAVGLAVAVSQAGYSIYFTTLDDLVRKLGTAKTAGRFPRQLHLPTPVRPGRRRGRLPAAFAGRDEHGLPADLNALRDRRDHSDLEQGLE